MQNNLRELYEGENRTRMSHLSCEIRIRICGNPFPNRNCINKLVSLIIIFSLYDRS